jgi:hypothetical protein
MMARGYATLRNAQAESPPNGRLSLSLSLFPFASREAAPDLHFSKVMKDKNASASSEACFNECSPPPLALPPPTAAAAPKPEPGPRDV